MPSIDKKGKREEMLRGVRGLEKWERGGESCTHKVHTTKMLGLLLFIKISISLTY